MSIKKIRIDVNDISQLFLSFKLTDIFIFQNHILWIDLHLLLEYLNFRYDQR